MARKPGPGKCVHCLEFAPKRNWDHVFPVSWYPSTTPHNLEKWKIPTCQPCNSEYGRIEEDLGQLLCLCIDPTRLESQGIYHRMRRAFDPRHARNDKDRRVREKRRKALLEGMLHGDEIPTQGIYPGLGERWGRSRADQIAITVPKRYIDRLAVKIVRGVAYVEDGTLIDQRYSIEPYVVAASGAVAFEEAISIYGHSLSRGPGIVVDRAVTPEDGVSSIYKITIWGQIVVYISVLPQEDDA